MDDAQGLVEPTHLDVFDEFTVNTRRSFADFVEGLNGLEDGSDEKRNELYERVKGACNLDFLKRIGGDISEYKRSISAAKGGAYVAAAAGGVCVAAGVLGHLLGPSIGYDIFRKVCQTALMGELGGIATYVVNAPLVPSNERYVRESMASLFGEEAVKDKYGFRAGIGAVTDTHSYIASQAEIHDILI